MASFMTSASSIMLEDDLQQDDAPETKLNVSADDGTELAPDALVIADDATQLTLAHPDALIRGFRALQQRIPGFTQLSVEEERALVRVASLDPDFLEAGIRAASAYDDTKAYVGRSAEELRQELDEVRHWDEAESEVRALLKGMSAANRKRRHRLGRAILKVYKLLGNLIHVEGYRPLRPYYEEMKRAYRAHKHKRPKASAE